MSEPPLRCEKQNCDTQEGRVPRRLSPAGPALLSITTGSCRKTSPVHIGRKNNIFF